MNNKRELLSPCRRFYLTLSIANHFKRLSLVVKFQSKGWINYSFKNNNHFLLPPAFYLLLNDRIPNFKIQNPPD